MNNKASIAVPLNISREQLLEALNIITQLTLEQFPHLMDRCRRTGELILAGIAAEYGAEDRIPALGIIATALTALMVDQFSDDLSKIMTARSTSVH